MRATLQLWGLASMLGTAGFAAAQSIPSAAVSNIAVSDIDASKAVVPHAEQAPAAASAEAPGSLYVPRAPGLPAGPVTPVAALDHPSTVQQLLQFQESDVKFKLRDLMEILSDHRHEGWVLAAYPDPKASQPLIGAGMSLDLPAREHPQRDPFNPHPFLEPSSADLWQAAGLDPQRLQRILLEFNRNLTAWKKKKFRRKIATLAPQITDEEANQLLRIAAIQAIFNAKAYCRNFDHFSAPQQMAVSQLVYQMGVNLEEFTQFLSLINSDSASEPLDGVAANSAAETSAVLNPEKDHWKAVQTSLIQSQWARLYRVRAVSVIAMLDPRYADSPTTAEREVSATLHPPAAHRRRGNGKATLQTTAYSGHSAKGTRKKKLHARGN